MLNVSFLNLRIVVVSYINLYLLYSFKYDIKRRLVRHLFDAKLRK